MLKQARNIQDIIAEAVTNINSLSALNKPVVELVNVLGVNKDIALQLKQFINDNSENLRVLSKYLQKKRLAEVSKVLPITHQALTPEVFDNIWVKYTQHFADWQRIPASPAEEACVFACFILAKLKNQITENQEEAIQFERHENRALLAEFPFDIKFVVTKYNGITINSILESENKLILNPTLCMHEFKAGVINRVRNKQQVTQAEDYENNFESLIFYKSMREHLRKTARVPEALVKFIRLLKEKDDSLPLASCINTLSLSEKEQLDSALNSLLAAELFYVLCYKNHIGSSSL